MSASRVRWLASCSASRSLKVAARAAKNVSWAARNRVHSCSSASLEARPARLPLGHQRLEPVRRRRPLGRVGQRLGLGDQLLLAGPGDAALLVERREVAAAAPGEGVPGGREALPQLLVGLAVDAADRLPLLDDGAEAVAGDLPLRALGQLLGLEDELLLGRGGRCPGRGPGRAGLLELGLGGARPARSAGRRARARSPTTATSPSDALQGGGVGQGGLRVARARRRAGSPAGRPRWPGPRTGGRSGPGRPPGFPRATSRPRARPPRCGRTPCRRCRPVPTRCWQSLPRSSSRVRALRPASSQDGCPAGTPRATNPSSYSPGVVSAVAFCPSPPLLVPELAAGAAGELDPLRAACREAVRRLLAAGPDQVVVIGTGPGAGGSRRAPAAAWPGTACR